MAREEPKSIRSARAPTHLGVDAHPNATTDTVDHPVVLLLVELLELNLLLPIVDGTDEDDDQDGDQNGDTLDPFNLRLFTSFLRETALFTKLEGFVVDTDGLVDTEDKRDNSGDTEDDL